MSLLCDRISLLIPLYLDHEIDSKEKFELTEHLQKCQRCSQVLQSEFAFKNTLAQGLKPLHIKAPSRLSYNIIRSLDITQNRISFFSSPTFRLQLIWSTAVIALGFFIFSIAKQTQSTSSSQIAQTKKPLLPFMQTVNSSSDTIANSISKNSSSISGASLSQKIKIPQEHIKLVKRIHKKHLPKHLEFQQKRLLQKDDLLELAREENLYSIPEVQLISHRR